MNAMLWTRACLVAVVATALGTAAHTTAGGLLPGPVVLASMFSALLVVSAAALTTPASYLRILALVGGGQAAVHLVLTVTAGHAAPHAPAAGQPIPRVLKTRPGGVRDQLAVVSDPNAGTAATGSGLQHFLDHLGGTDAPMMAAHLAAAGGVAWWLWRGEQSAWTLLALLWSWITPPHRRSGAWRPLAKSVNSATGRSPRPSS